MVKCWMGIITQHAAMTPSGKTGRAVFQMSPGDGAAVIDDEDQETLIQELSIKCLTYICLQEVC